MSLNVDEYNEEIRQREIEKSRKDGMNAGIALVCGMLVSDFQLKQVSRRILNIECGITTKQELIDSLVEQYDIDRIGDILE